MKFFSNLLSTFLINLFINFYQLFYERFLNFWSSFDQLYQLLINPSTTFGQLFNCLSTLMHFLSTINFESAVCQHFINTWEISCCLLWKYPVFPLHWLFAILHELARSWSRHDYLMFLWPRCCGQCVRQPSTCCGKATISAPGEKLLLLGACSPLSESFPSKKIVPWFVVSLIIGCLEAVCVL